MLSLIATLFVLPAAYAQAPSPPASETAPADLRQARRTLAAAALVRRAAAHRATAVPAQDSLALVVLYDSTNGSGWSSNENWLTGPVASWQGVTVDGDRVTGLDLSLNNLTGALPPALGDLDALTFLDLSFNNLTGPIPPTLSNLSVLTDLYLTGNNLSGAIPASLGSLSALIALDLVFNRLEGPIPTTLADLEQLVFLDVSFNQLEGTLPAELAGLPNLEVLGVAGNRLTGEIPAALGDLANLINLDVSYNGLEGLLPETIGNLTNLTSLVLSRNALSGPLPLTLTNLTALQEFDFALTDLCVPADDAFQTWLAGVAQVSGSSDLCTDISTEGRGDVPATYVLEQNYPNPFNPRTAIRFTLPAAGPVTVAVFDVLGRTVAVLTDGIYPAGTHVIDFDAADLQSGTYLYRLTTATFVDTRSMTLLK